MGMDEALREFTAYHKSGWSNSEVPSCTSLLHALDALERQVQVKAIKRGNDRVVSFRCGRCGEFLDSNHKYCCGCGQMREKGEGK